ncbi:MAG TPA: hypothetical protein VM534_07500, partial [Thermoanaerobaculia bacterium]|nr:hypothetical protein [Thermoanaerobaculia bacterium]
EISGWQVSEKSARRFLFTGERSSYGAALGQTENLGVIEAIWFRERRPRFTPRLQGRDSADPGGRSKSEASGESRERAASAPQVEGQSADTSDDYAATGMGDRMRHGVERVHLELESTPLASVRLRYEFRPQLVELGIFPDRLTVRDRRGRARGFDGWCPEP